MTSQATIVNQDAVGIPVRRMDFEFDDSIPTFWFAGDPFRTLLLSALSCTFPEGERMFMRSVRHFQGGVRNPTLQKEVRAFIGQEANHGKEHEAFNAMMNRKGLPIAKIEAFVSEGIKKEEGFFSPERMLAKTCALEHFTAMFAEMILKNPEILDGVDERLMPLWLWHAVEESEHKSVAFDVYQDQVGSYWVRVSEMALTSVLFSFFTTLNTATLLRAAGHSRDWRMIGKGLNGLFGRKGWMRGMLPRYLDYYRPGFHPAQHDATALREKGLKLLDAWLARRQKAA
jgi:predicted metal-dependent hydrolase